MAKKSNPVRIKKPKKKLTPLARKRKNLQNLIKASEAGAKKMVGNQWWKLRTTHGVQSLFNDPMVLLKGAEEYFNMVDDNPIEEIEEHEAHGIQIKKVVKRHKKPYTLAGFCLFLNVGKTYWSEFKKSVTGKSGDFPKVIELIENAMYAQKLEGAASGIFNANIIARDLGLRENIDNTTQGEKINTPLVVNSYNTAPPLLGSEDEIDENKLKGKK